MHTHNGEATVSVKAENTPVYMLTFTWFNYYRNAYL